MVQQMPNNTPGRYDRMIRDLQTQINELRAARTLESATISSGSLTLGGGNIVIPAGGTLKVDGGNVVMNSPAPSATVLFSLGPQTYGDRGIMLNRDDGTTAISIRKVFGPGDVRQSMTIFDPAGGTIGGDSALSPSGFDAPHINMPFIPVDYTSSATAQTTSSTTFVATHEHRGFRQNPAIKPQLMVKCSDATTAAEIQIYDAAGTHYLGGYFASPPTLTLTVPTGTTTFTLFEFSQSLQIGYGMSDSIYLQIHARVTAGTGSVSVAPVRTFGHGF